MTQTVPRPLSDRELEALPQGPEFLEQTWDLQYRHALGVTTRTFLGGLKARRILGRDCPQCHRVLVPARSFCDRCHCDTGAWVEVAPRGTIQMFTIIYEHFKGLPPPPYALAYVLLEGADTALLGYVRGVDLTDARKAAQVMAIGTPVTVAFVDEPRGDVTDYWFEVASTSA